ncbi:hypothetical protein M8C21_026744, partial [Ambrosia artemisiifolia]
MDPFSEPVSQLSDAVKFVIQTTAHFKPQLRQLKSTLERIAPIIDDIQNRNRKLGSTQQEQEMFIKEIQEAQKLVNKCSKIKWNFFKWFTHSLKLKDLDQKLLRFFQIEVQAVQCRDIKELLEEVKYVTDRKKNSETCVALEQKLSSRSMQMSSKGEKKSETSKRKKIGWRVPPLPRGIVGFEEPLKNLKAKILSDDGSSMDCGAGKVVVVSAAGGCGKTTLVKMLCNDPQIQDNIGDNVFFVTVSETPDFIASVNDLFNPDCFDRQIKFQGIEDAKNKLENFLREKLSGPILLVLDDVWDESYIENFEFDIKGYKLLVTSRIRFPKYEVFKFNPLSDEHAKILFLNSTKADSTIDENLVDKMVKCCKNHPLTISVVGGSLNGKNKVAWESMLNSLSQGHSVLDLNQEVLHRLERSFEALEVKFKQCFLDFGLFLEDQRIPASTLLDMWVHLYHHDDEGIDTLAKIYELSYRNLVNDIDPSSDPKYELQHLDEAARRNLLAIALGGFLLNGHSSCMLIPFYYCLSEEDSHSLPNVCVKQFVTQHDLLRQLAINLNSKLPVVKRPRLVINAKDDRLITNVQEDDQIASIEQIEEPMQARLLSISTGEEFSSRWCNIRVPEVEVMVLNLKSKTYTLPPFLKEMQKMKVLNITNYGFQPTELKEFHLLDCLSNLTRIRLEKVAISSLGRSTLELVNLQKISFTKCKMNHAFEELTTDNLNVWPRLVEIEMDKCKGLVVYPGILCNSVYLKKLSITNCTNLCEISEDFGKLTSLETLILHNCTELKKLPESITKLLNLSILDISDCLNLQGLPELLGSLGGLRTIYVSMHTGVQPQSIEYLSNTNIVTVPTSLDLVYSIPETHFNKVTLYAG